VVTGFSIRRWQAHGKVEGVWLDSWHLVLNRQLEWMENSKHHLL
jgi:hypothetical protein